MKLITLATALTITTTATVSGVKVPCTNEFSCRNAAGPNKILYTNVSAGNTKGCFTKKDNAYFIPGTVPQMMDEDLPSEAAAPAIFFRDAFAPGFARAFVDRNRVVRHDEIGVDLEAIA